MQKCFFCKEQIRDKELQILHSACGCIYYHHRPCLEKRIKEFGTKCSSCETDFYKSEEVRKPSPCPSTPLGWSSSSEKLDSSYSTASLTEEDPSIAVKKEEKLPFYLDLSKSPRRRNLEQKT